MTKTLIFTLAIFTAVIAFGTLLGADMLPPGQSFAFTPHYFEGAGTLLAVVLTITLGAAYSEKRSWNNGICKQTGQPWVSFDMDSQGGRGYKSGENTVWISYPVDTRAAA